ncbi:beta-eliminating lyase-related protein [Kitasatospora aureofaciens]|uniref:threonine aldolase family protein n=1 Tax=Kitasatospora aureofaciens TaxID=1894 RepID=UPI001D9A755B|nr:beta-eliminating lyase-related protein [Kitasatospora aureofaciens]HJD84245.1 threonine aldolase [Kitasatospora aureofaciens]
MTHDDQIDWGRLRAARRACTRLLSGSRPLTIHERLTALTAAVEPDVRPDFYGDGGPVGELEERTAALLGTEDAVLFPTGTMAQQVALRYHAERAGNRAVALHPLSHIERHERHAHTQLTGLRGLWPTTEQRQPTPEELRALGEPFGTLVVELPLRDPGYILPTWDELTELTAAARESGARVHFDGARLWNTTAHFGKRLDEIAALADSVYVSFYKDLGGISGAALAGTTALTAYARTWRHRYGGQLYQQWPAALSALSGLDTELPRLAGYTAHAATLVPALAALPGARVHPAAPPTHEFQLWLPHAAKTLNAAALALAEQEKTWFLEWTDAAPGLAMAEVSLEGPAQDWTPQEVTEVGLRLLELVATGSGGPAARQA